jgi:hypothetical protein
VTLNKADQLEGKRRKNYVILGLQERRYEQYGDSMQILIKVMKRNGSKSLG